MRWARIYCLLISMDKFRIAKPVLILAGLICVSALASLGGIIKLSQISVQLKTPLTNKVEIHQNRLFKDRIVIDLEGAVTKPGVYELPNNSRLIDALHQAQGLSDNADRYLVAKTFNLAKRLADEEKVYIPFLEERDLFIPDSLSQNLISINGASQTQLELLPAIGPVTAKKIIDGRPYTNLEELLSKKAVGAITYEKIVNLITL